MDPVRVHPLQIEDPNLSERREDEEEDEEWEHENGSIQGQGCRHFSMNKSLLVRHSNYRTAQWFNVAYLMSLSAIDLHFGDTYALKREKR